MAINRYLYPPDGTNIVKLKQLFSAVSIDASTPAAPVLTIAAGCGVTITRTGTGTYAVTLDNSSTVSQVVDAEIKLVTGATYDATKVVACRIKSISTSGFVFESYAPSNGTVADINVSGTLLVSLSATTSSVRA